MRASYLIAAVGVLGLWALGGVALAAPLYGELPPSSPSPDTVDLAPPPLPLDPLPEAPVVSAPRINWSRPLQDDERLLLNLDDEGGLRVYSASDASAGYVPVPEPGLLNLGMGALAVFASLAVARWCSGRL